MVNITTNHAITHANVRRVLNFQPCCGSCLSSCDVSVLGKRFAVHTKMTDLHLLNEFTFEMTFSLESVCFLPC